jgi:hypothetical protein
MCSIYSVAKISDQKKITFNTIINNYAHLFSSKEYVTQIYTQCVVNQDTGETKDIINFYNEVYLKQMKNYILLYKDDVKKKVQTPGVPGKNMGASRILTPQGTKPFVKAFCPMTPLMENYPSKPS